MKKILLITTFKDFAVPLFYSLNIKKVWGVDIIHTNYPLEDIKNYLISNVFDVIYIRDPFNSAYDQVYLKALVEIVLECSKEARIIDNINSINDLLIEDKWLQYEKYNDFMPYTQLLSSSEEFDSSFIIKKRISSRGKGISFDRGNVLDANNYVIQSKLTLDKEYRVYILFGRILPKISTKKPVTLKTKGAVLSCVTIPKTLEAYVNTIVPYLKGDLIGLDIGQVGDKFTLIEVNRSPQFTAYYSHSGINIAELLLGEFVDHI